MVANLYTTYTEQSDSLVPTLLKVCDYVKENGTYDGEDEEDEYDEHGHRCTFQQPRNKCDMIFL